jgi:arylsulfatase
VIQTARLLILPILVAALTLPAAAQQGASSVLPNPPEPFKGTINLRAKDSKPDFPQPIQAPKGAPNIFLVLLDDVGYGATSTFGGPINTPTLQKLADNGLRYNQFHTTALCGPTRAALLTGRNHHSAHTGVIMEGGTGFPGKTDDERDRNGCGDSQAGQARTAWFGKNHNVPDWESSQAGPLTAGRRAWIRPFLRLPRR